MLLSENIPDKIVMASVRGTYGIPQIYCASAISVGATAMPLLLGGETTWSDLQFGTVTNKQADRVGRAVNAAHEKYNILARYNPDQPEGTTDTQRANGAPVLMSRDSLKTVTANSIFNMATTAAMFTAVVALEELEHVMTSHEVAGRNPFHELSNPMLHEFFTNPRYKPRVLALGGLWQSAVTLLREKKFLKQAADYRTGISEKYGTDGYTPHRSAMEGRMYQALQTRLGPMTVRQEIKRQSGYLIPPEAVEIFARNVSFTLRHMPSRTRGPRFYDTL